MLRGLKKRLFPVDPVLPGYRQPLNDNWILIRNFSALATLVLIAIFYGLLSAIFPISFYVYLALPLIVIGIIVIWALPDTGRFPDRIIEALFWGFLYAQLIWPNYVALVLPGMPWISVNRVITGTMAVLFLFFLAQSKETRALIYQLLTSSSFVTRCFVILCVLQVITLPFSDSIATSVNKLIDAEIQWNMVFIISAYIFAKEGRSRKFFIAYLVCLSILVFVAFFEWLKSGVLWADIIPSFMRSDSESTTRLLGGSARHATGIYRVQSIFSTSLNFAEVLGLATPFLIYWAIYAKRNSVRLLNIVLLAPFYWMILKTDSRLGVVGFFMSFIIFSGIYGVRRWAKRKGDLIGPAITLAYPFATALFVLATFVSGRLAAVVWGNGPQAASNEGRKMQWLLAFPKIGSWPFGNGPGMGAQTLGTYNENLGTLTIDSYYLVILLEYGVLGFVVWLGMWIGAAVQAIKWSFADDSDEATMLPVMATFILVFVVLKGVLAQDDSHGVYYMMLGMIVGMNWRAKQRQLRKTQSSNLVK